MRKKSGPGRKFTKTEKSPPSPCRPANANALRIRKAYEGQGHISALIKCMEAYARAHGIRKLSIGVEAAQTRNLGIYLHWGFTRFVTYRLEEGHLILYYEKDLTAR